jgi:O-antigen/teichoic acid export membrane protein
MSAGRGLSHAHYVLVNRLAMPIGSLLVLIILGRHSDRLLGEYALVMTFYFVMQMLPLLGLTPYVMRETARNPRDAGRYFASVGALSLAGCVVVDVAAAAFLRGVSYEAPVPAAVGIVGLVIFPGILLFIAELVFMSLHRARPIALVAVGENVVRLGLTVAALELGHGLLTLVWIFLATRTAALIACLVVMRRLGILERGVRPDPAIIRRTLSVLPAFLSGALLFVIVSRVDFLVLSLYHAVDVIGVYAIAYRVYEISINILTALIMAVFPAIARRYVGARSRFRVVARSAFSGFVCIIVLMSFTAGMLAPEYVLLLFPRQYPTPVATTQLFALVLAVSAVDFVASGILYAIDRQASDTRAMAAGSLLTALLLFALVPAYAVLRDDS